MFLGWGGGSGGIGGGAIAVWGVVIVDGEGPGLSLWVFARSGGGCRMRLGVRDLWLWWL